MMSDFLLIMTPFSTDLQGLYGFADIEQVD
jgi:hypothetical protein